MSDVIDNVPLDVAVAELANLMADGNAPDAVYDAVLLLPLDQWLVFELDGKLPNGTLIKGRGKLASQRVMRMLASAREGDWGGVTEVATKAPV